MLCVLPSYIVKAQEIKGFVVMAIVIDGDTVPVISLPEVKVFAPLKFKSKADAIQFTKTNASGKIGLSSSSYCCY